MLNLFKNSFILRKSNFTGFTCNLIKTSKMGFAKIERIRKSINNNFLNTHFIYFSNFIVNEKLQLNGFNAKFYEEAKQQMPMNENGLVKLDKKIFSNAVEQ
jgi:hypothetical protein